MDDHDRTYVLYWLGAGASAGAIPPVNQFLEGLEAFKNYCVDHSHVEVVGQSDRIANEIFIEHINEVLKSAGNHTTIDTYARRLYLTNREQLTKLKAILTCFFMWKERAKELVLGANGEKKTYRALDLRYDSLIASTIEDEKRALPANIGFVSWNYDGQIELASMNYTSGTDTGNSILSATKLLKINGSYRSNFGRDVFAQYEATFIGDIDGYVKLYGELTKSSAEEGDKFGIKFAWEDPERISNLEKDVKGLVEVAQGHSRFEIVICGYSFPFYNRKFDEVVFANLNDKFDRLVLQYPADEIQRIKRRIDLLFPRLRGRLSPSALNNPEVLLENSDLSSFYIPYRVI